MHRPLDAAEDAAAEPAIDAIRPRLIRAAADRGRQRPLLRADAPAADAPAATPRPAGRAIAAAAPTPDRIRRMTVTVAIVGRPNVGKSTLFNRLVGRKIALVDDTPGVTRDRREAEGRIADLKFRILDTAGYEDVNDGSLEDRMRQQTELAIKEADVILFMIDARAGVVPLDQRFAQVLRKAGKDVHLVGNKAEGRRGRSRA